MSLLRTASRALPLGLPLLLLLLPDASALSQQSGTAAISPPDYALMYPFAVDTNTADTLRPRSVAEFDVSVKGGNPLPSETQPSQVP